MHHRRIYNKIQYISEHIKYRQFQCNTGNEMNSTGMKTKCIQIGKAQEILYEECWGTSN
jgi:hypothetical protein